MEKEYALRYRRLFQQHWWWRSREKVILKCIQQYAGERRDLQILDIGCGDGLFFDALSEFGDVRGVEIDDRIVDPEGPHYDLIHVGAFDQSYQTNAPLSIVLMLDVLEHLQHPEECLSHALNLLADDGIAIVTVPAFNWLWTQHDEINQHYIRYNKRSFADLANESRMHIDRCEYFYQWMVPAKIAVRMKERMFPSEPRPADLPPAAINCCLQLLCQCERQLVGWMKLPFGTSLLAIGRRVPNQDK